MTGTRRRQSLRPALRSGRPPRRSTGTARRGIPNKTIFAWAGIVLIALLIILYFVFFGGKDGDVAPGTSGSVPSSTSQPADSTPPDASSAAPVETIPRDEWYMVLANRSSVLPGDFTVAETATVGEAVVDARIAEALRQMVNDAAATGVKLKPTNGYRSIARQQELWDARVKTLMEGGLSQADAETKAIDYTSAPGTSDHNTGLGLDIVSEDHPAKDAGFAETAAAQWLAEHAADYGFIPSRRIKSRKAACALRNIWHSKAETETLWPAPRKCGAGFLCLHRV